MSFVQQEKAAQMSVPRESDQGSVHLRPELVFQEGEVARDWRVLREVAAEAEVVRDLSMAMSAREVTEHVWDVRAWKLGSLKS
jgi:hypothetical protein